MRSNKQLSREVRALLDRKPSMQLKRIAAALTLTVSLAHGGYSLAAGEATAKPANKRPNTQVTSEDMLARTVFQALVGEFALQRGDAKLSSDAWTDLAQRTRDPKVVARATEVAGFARQFERALELSKLWIEVEPESNKARQTQSSLLILTNRLDELGPQLATLLARDKPNLGNNLLHLNRMLARHTDKKAIQALVDRLAAPYDSLPEAHFAMAQAAANAGDNLRALNETEKSLQLRPDWENAALARAQIQARLSPLTAIDSLSPFVDANPAARDARLALARLLIAEKRYDEARRHFERLIADNPDNPDVIYPVAMLALQQGDTTTGRAQLERLLTTDFADKSTIHFFLGQLDQEQKNTKGASEHFQQVTAGHQYIAARARLAQILLQQGQADEARELLRNTRGGTVAERTQLVLAESQILREAGRHNDAYIVLDSALTTQPDNPEILYEAALTAERIGKPEILEMHLKHLLSLKPDHAHALNALGYSWTERNIRLPEAQEMITRALSLTPEDPFIMDSMGWVLYRQGKLAESLKTLENAYRLKADPEIAAHLGEVLWTLNRKDDARRILQEASKAHPENDVLSGAVKKFLP
ncbi:MAG: pilus assembly protein TadD [Betaproteobacteria bacterium HGW-Betaproteobacteria-6]|jgi:tetratricopeptide (TPR) repeat protein|nr:MAG: pilus assembly protein TadD [Betaproteobacteria bacterium HGW-Betaproteobacteria-6]